MEPENILAIYNRAILLDKTGDLRAAIRDYTRMIDQFPNFWNGLARRASCYRRLGMTAKAELDEFRIFKAQNNKHLGIQPRWSAAKRKQMRRRSEIDPNSEIVVTCGSTEAMMAAMMTVTDPGDKVIIFSPFYENYGADTILSGAQPIYVPLVPPDFHFDPAVLEDAFRQKPKALVLCNPSNPCGKVFTWEELEIIASLARKYDAYVITDEVYEHIVYAPHRHTYFATNAPPA